jgi:hypothetical protein
MLLGSSQKDNGSSGSFKRKSKCESDEDDADEESEIEDQAQSLSDSDSDGKIGSLALFETDLNQTFSKCYVVEAISCFTKGCQSEIISSREFEQREDQIQSRHGVLRF